MKNWVCENCGNLGPPEWKKRGNQAYRVFLGVLFSPLLMIGFLIPGSGFLNKAPFTYFSLFWKGISSYKICSKCGGKVLYPADSSEGQEVLEKYWNSSHPSK
jgi:hypothetical protein